MSPNSCTFERLSVSPFSTKEGRSDIKVVFVATKWGGGEEGWGGASDGFSFKMSAAFSSVASVFYFKLSLL